MIYAGIDPGKTGGVALINEDGLPLRAAPFTSFKETFNVVSVTDIFTVLEKVHSHPKQGVKSVFNFGANYGGWKALLEVNEISFIEAPPQTWQKKILGVFPKGQSKQRAFEYITKRYPKLGLRKKDEGIIDAFCLALYARFIHLNQL